MLGDQIKKTLQHGVTLNMKASDAKQNNDLQSVGLL